MNTVKTIVMVVVLAAGLMVCAAKAATTSEMLQKGLYAEEVEGNMESAIKIYSEVIKKSDGPRNQGAQALYRRGTCYLKIKDEAAARADFERLVNEYGDQAEIVQKAQIALEDLMDFDAATLMPPDTLVYLEIGSPGKQVETVLNMLKGTPYENPLAAIYNQSQAPGNKNQAIQKTPGDFIGAMLNPSMMAEFKKIRGCAIGVTGVAQNNPPMIMVLYPGKSDALRGLIMMGLNMAGAPGEPIEGMQTINIQNAAGAAYDDKVIIVAQPAEQLKWCVRQYRGLSKEPTLASSNPSFAKVNKKMRHDNMLTIWGNIDEIYAKALPLFEKGGVSKQLYLVDTVTDFNHIDYLTFTNAIEQDGFNDTAEIVFKEGHHCLAYDLIRTPNINKAALTAVPPEAVAVVTFAMSAENEKQASAVQTQIKNLSGLDIGREIFANIEQVSIFAVPPKSANSSIIESVGLAITSHNPQQTRQILAKTVGTADTVFSGRSNIDANLFGGKYQIGQIQNNPLYCYIEQSGKVTVISLNPDITSGSIAAMKSKKSICNEGPLSDLVNKMPATASKMILVNAGGAIRVATPIIMQSAGVENKQELAKNFNQLAAACDKTAIEIRTDEQINSFSFNRRLTGLPPVNQIFVPISKIVQTINEGKANAVAEEARKKAGIAIRQSAAAPVIDGKEDDAWANAEKIKLTNVLYAPVSSPNDLAANFKTMWDQNNLYLLVNVSDDVLKNDSGEHYQDDAIEIYIDCDNSKTTQFGENDYQFIFAWDKTSGHMEEGKHNRSDGVAYALATTDSGYRLEAVFPWSTLGVKPSIGSKIGLEVQVDDDDDEGDRESKMIWHSDKDEAWQNPQTFGNAELGGLIGWWKLDEKEGTAALDSSGNGNDGRLAGSPKWRPGDGKIGGAIELSGNGDYIKINNESPFDITNQITISAWVNIKSVPQEWTAIVTKGDSAWRMSTDYANSIPHFGVGAGVNTNDNFVSGKTTVNSGQWHNFACVYDGKEMRIYIDGKLEISKPRSGPIGTNDIPVCIGENLELTGRCFNGLIDDVRIYNYAISQTEIAALAGGK